MNPCHAITLLALVRDEPVRHNQRWKNRPMRNTFRPGVRHVLALAFLASTTAAQAIVVYSGVVNWSIPNTATGLYVNVIDGSRFSGPGNFPTLGGPGANYDFNLYGTASWTFFSPGTSGQSVPTVPVTSRGYLATQANGPASALTAGALISNASLFNTGSPSGSLVTTGSPVIFGFRFRNENDLSTAADDTVHFGWARVVLNPGTPGLLVDYAFESNPLTGIQAGAVPEPATWALLLGGVMGLAHWSRRGARRGSRHVLENSKARP